MYWKIRLTRQEAHNRAPVQNRGGSSKRGTWKHCPGAGVTKAQLVLVGTNEKVKRAAAAFLPLILVGKDWMRKVWICCWVGQAAVGTGKVEVLVPCALLFSSVRSHKLLYLVKEFREGKKSVLGHGLSWITWELSKPGETVPSAPLGVFKTQLDKDLSKLIQRITLLSAGGWSWPLKVPSSLNRSVVLYNVCWEGCPQPFSSLFEFWSVCCNSVCRR